MEIKNSICFEVPAMSVDVMTKNPLTGKKMVKRDDQGRPISVEKILPKERPRFGHTKKGVPITFNTSHNIDFEEWIRHAYFQAYHSSCGVICNGKPWGTSNVFLGCQWLGEDHPCDRFRKGKDFEECKKCIYRRKNLSLVLGVYLKDDRHLDLDNLLKIVLDALNKVCYYDDMLFVDKRVLYIPYSAQKEHLTVAIAVLPEHLKDGSLVGGYSFKGLSATAAEQYATFLLEMPHTGIHANKKTFVEYIERCDGRTYISKLKETT
jgi:hypothetical protein